MLGVKDGNDSVKKYITIPHVRDHFLSLPHVRDHLFNSYASTFTTLKVPYAFSV